MGLLNIPRVPRTATLEEAINIFNMALEEMEHRINGFLQSSNIQEVGGWRVGSAELQSKDGDVGMSTEDTAGDDVRFWAGGADKNTAPFRVTESGNITAESGTITGAVVQNQFATGNKVYINSTGFHANDTSGVERITIGTTPAKGAKAVVFRDTSGAEKALLTYDTETLDGASRTGQYFVGPNAQVILFQNDGSFRIMDSTGAGFKSDGGRPELNDGFGWSEIAKKSEVDSKATSGASTSSNGGGSYNGGIPIGTELAVNGGGFVTWSGISISSHSHTQS